MPFHQVPVDTNLMYLNLPKSRSRQITHKSTHTHNKQTKNEWMKGDTRFISWSPDQYSYISIEGSQRDLFLSVVYLDHQVTSKIELEHIQGPLPLRELRWSIHKNSTAIYSLGCLWATPSCLGGKAWVFLLVRKRLWQGLSSSWNKLWFLMEPSSNLIFISNKLCASNSF